jgi:hypothetical protein
MAKIAAAFVIILTLQTLLSGASFKEYFPKGYIDWTNGVINIAAREQGKSGKLQFGQAYQEAFAEAYKDYISKVKELINGLRVDEQTVAGQMLKDNTVLTSEVERLIERARFNKVQYGADGSATIHAILPLFGSQGIGSLLVSSKLGPAVVNEPVEKRNYINFKSELLRTPDGNLYTGLIVDARALNLKPALLPKVLDRKNNIIYGDSSGLAVDTARDRGTAAYVYSLDEARALKDRIGNHPLVVKAIFTSGAFQTDVILFNRDALILQQANNNLNFLKYAGVVFVLRGKN